MARAEAGHIFSSAGPALKRSKGKEELRDRRLHS